MSASSIEAWYFLAISLFLDFALLSLLLAPYSANYRSRERTICLFGALDASFRQHECQSPTGTIISRFVLASLASRTTTGLPSLLTTLKIPLPTQTCASRFLEPFGFLLRSHSQSNPSYSRIPLAHGNWKCLRRRSCSRWGIQATR